MDPALASRSSALRVRLSSAFGEAAYRSEVARSNSDPIPRPLAITLQMPVAQLASRERSGHVERLMREIEQVARLFDRDRDVIALHVEHGAGVTPQLREIEVLIGSLERHFHFGPATRRVFSIRLDPGAVRPGDLAACASLGFHCADIVAGSGDLSAALFAIDAARRDGLPSTCVEWSMDGGRIPDALLDARPGRLTCVLPATPDEGTSLLALQPVAAALAEAGYIDIGLDPRPLPWIDPGGAPQLSGITRECRWHDFEADVDLIGLGVGAVSRISDSVCQNLPDVGPWGAALDAASLPVWRGLRLATDDRLRMDLIGEFLRTGEVAVDVFEQRHGIDFTSYFSRELRALDALPAGLIDRSPGRLRATSQGRLMLRIMAACFDQPGPRPPQ